MSELTSAGPTVRFGRLERRNLLLGLSAPQTALVGLALVLVTAGLYLAGGAGLVAALPIAGPLAALGLLSREGRLLVDWLPVAAHWRIRRAVSQTRYLARPRPAAAATDLALPGDAARLRVLIGPGTGAALVHDPHAHTLTAALAVCAPPFLLAAADTQHQHVAGYGRLLAALSRHAAVTRVQVLQRAGAAPGHELRRWWQQHGVHDGGWAAGILADLIADAGATSERHETYLAVTLDSRHGTDPAGRRLNRAVAAMESELRALHDAAEAAQLTPIGWLDPPGLASLVRTTYDPDATPTATPTGPGVVPGPMAVVESWDRLRSDSAHHAVYWIAEWPRAEVTAGFLQPLVLMPGVRRAMSLTAEPLPVTRALREIRRAKVEHAADTAQRHRLGRVEDEAALAEAADVVRRERELADGHTDLRFAGLLAVSAPTEAELADACGRLEQAAGQAMCELRRLYGQQAQAFAAAALPLTRGLG